jgi:hypothetical protein
MARIASDKAADQPRPAAAVDDLPADEGPQDDGPPQRQVSIAPWEFPATIRELLLQPVREAGVTPPIRCSAPLVDAGYLVGEAGVVIPLANWTLVPIPALTLEVAVARRCQGGVGASRATDDDAARWPAAHRAAAGEHGLRAAALYPVGRERRGKDGRGEGVELAIAPDAGKLRRYHKHPEPPTS